MKRLSWKYLAGLIDGEGCIDMQVCRMKLNGMFYCRPRVRICMSGIAGKDMSDNLIANFGGSLDGRRRDFINPKWQPAYSWQLTGKTNLRKFAQNVANHLIVKKEQMKFIIWWLDNIGGTQITENVRRVAIDELKAMKVDPHRLSEGAAKKVADAIVR